jgi:hypothetical protein
MLPNILCSCIFSCIILKLVSGWKIPGITSNMQLLMWLYMPHGVFCDWLFFVTCPRWLQDLVIVYFQISSSECGLTGNFQIDKFIIIATMLNVVYNKQTKCDVTQR